jgi:hypothetical protein
MSCPDDEICLELISVTGSMNLVQDFPANPTESGLTVVHRAAGDETRGGCRKKIRHSAMPWHLLAGQVARADCNMTRFECVKD